MEQAKVTSKGQITIPKKIREKLNISPGDRINFVEEEDGKIKIYPQKKSIERLKGILYRPGQKALSIEEMNEGVTEYLREKYKK